MDLFVDHFGPDLTGPSETPRDLGDLGPRDLDDCRAGSEHLQPRQIQHPDVVDHVCEALQRAGLPASCLILEVTEGVLLEDTDAVAVTLSALKGIGVRLALDDFGTGFSSLSYLDRFQMDIVKIDKSFIDSLGGAGAAPSPLVGAIVQLGGMLGLDVTAEGIEDEQQLECLRAMGCRHGQGYLFARPLSEPDLRALAAETAAARHLRRPPPRALDLESC